jgi:hypothetical protein
MSIVPIPRLNCYWPVLLQATGWEPVTDTATATADWRTKQNKCPAVATSRRVGPSASSARFFTGQQEMTYNCVGCSPCIIHVFWPPLPRRLQGEDSTHSTHECKVPIYICDERGSFWPYLPCSPAAVHAGARPSYDATQPHSSSNPASMNFPHRAHDLPTTLEV